MEIRISDEYSSLIPELANAEYESLKESIKHDGLWIPLIVNQDGVLLDGHHRYKACQELGIKEPRYEVKEFKNEYDEKLFVIDCNLKRRQLNNFQRIELALKSKAILKEIAKNNMSSGARGVRFLTPLGRVDEQIGERANSSRDSVRKVEKILEHMSPESKELEELRTGDLSINQAYDLVKEESRKQSDNIKYLYNVASGTAVIPKQQEPKTEEQYRQPQYILDARQAMQNTEEILSLMGQLMEKLTGITIEEQARLRDTMEKGKIFRMEIAEKSKDHYLRLSKQIPDGYIVNYLGVLQSLHFLLDKFEEILSDEAILRKSKSEMAGE